MRFPIPLVIFLLLVGWLPSCASGTDPVDALVHIFSRHPEHVAGRGVVYVSAVGAGFFVESNGLVLTAYHVVAGGADLSVYDSSGGLCSNPVVVAYDQHRDLAALRCNPARGVASFLQIAENFEPLPLSGGIIYGHPNSKLNQRASAEFPLEHIIKSDRYFVGAGEELFSKPPQDLIEIQAVIEVGMSGGPVMLGGKVIGVISGSQGVGGMQQGWAIPARVLGQLKHVAITDPSSLPPSSILLSGRMPTTFLRVGIPKERLILISENASSLAATRNAIDQWKIHTGSRTVLLDLRDRLRQKKRIQPRDVCAVAEAMWTIDHLTPYRYKDQCQEKYREAYRDAVMRAVVQTPLGEIDLGSARVKERDGGSIFLTRLASISGSVGQSVQEEFRENRTLAIQIDKLLGKPLLENYRLDHVLESEVLSPHENLRSTVSDLAELGDLENEWETAVRGVIALIEPYEQGASKVRLTAKRFYTVMTGALAELYIADLLSQLDLVSHLQEELLRLADVELSVLEKTLSLNGKPDILELRLEAQ